MLSDSIVLIEGSNVSNLVVVSGSDFPASPDLGELFYKTTATAGLYIYNGIEWQTPVVGSVDFSNLSVKQAVRAATTADITLSGAQTIDGVSVVSPNRVLVKNQLNATQNGIYVVQTGAWTRATDFDGSPASEVVSGAFMFVSEGTTNGSTGWVLVTQDPITIGTSNLSFAKFSGTQTPPGGITNSIQYNDAGVFGGSPNFTWDNSANTLTFASTTAVIRQNQDAGNLNLFAGNSSLTGAGNINLYGGNNTANNGTGGAVFIRGGTTNGTGTSGGQVSILGGNALTDSNGGNIVISAGAAAGAGRVGGILQIEAGTSPAGAGGWIQFSTGATKTARMFINASGSIAFGTSQGNTGTSGQVLTSAGANAAPTWTTLTSVSSAGSANSIQVSNGSGGFVASSFYTSGATFSIDAAPTLQPQVRPSSGLTGYNIAIRGGNSSALTAGAGGAGAGGILFLLGGDGGIAGSGSGGDGGQVRIAGGTGGTASGFPGDGGDIVINGGLAGNDAASNKGGSIVFSTAQRNSGAFGLTERLRISEFGAFGLNGANYGSAGQVLSSNGASATPSWVSVPTVSANNTWTGTNTFSANTITFGTTDAGNKIKSDFTGAAETRAAFETTAAGSTTVIDAIPSAGGAGSAWASWNDNNRLQASYLSFSASLGALGYNHITSGTTGTATPLPIVFRVTPTVSGAATEALRILNSGALSFGSSGTATGTSGQVLTSAGSGAPPTWTTPATPLAPAGNNNELQFKNGTSLGADSGLSWVSNVLRLGTAAAPATIAPVQPTTAVTGASLDVLGGSGSTLTSAGGDLNLAGGNGTSSAAGGNVKITSGGSNSASNGGYIRFVTRNLAAYGETERFRILNNGAWSVGTGGAAYGTAGQVLTSNGNAAPTWATPSTAITLTTAAQPNVTSLGTLTSLNVSGSVVVTGTVTAATPTLASHLATKDYVDTVATGLSFKSSVRAATTGNITLSGLQTIDGVSLVAGNRVLVKDQTTGSQNGIYVVDAGAWSRSADFDGSPASEVSAGAYMFVREGTLYANSGWVLSTPDPITVGSTSLSFTQFTGLAQIDAGAGLSKTGSQLNIGTASASRIVVNTDNIDLATTGVGAGSYGLATAAPQITVDAYGRITSAGVVTITPAFSSITGKPTTLAGYGITDGANLGGATFTGQVSVPAVFTVEAQGAEGGEIHLKKGTGQTALNGDVIIDTVSSVLRVFENGGANRNFQFDLATGAIFHTSPIVITGSSSLNVLKAGDIMSGNLYVQSAVNGFAEFGAINTSTGNAAVAAVGASNGTSSVFLARYSSGHASRASTAWLNVDTAHPLVFGTSNTERMRIDATGNIGVGTPSPAARFDINVITASTPTAMFGRGVTDNNFQLVARNGIAGTGVGTRQFTFGMEYSGGGLTTGLEFLRGGGAADGTLTFFTNAAERMRINSSGDVQIGDTANPFSAALHVRRSTGVAKISVFSASTSEARLQLLNNNNNVAIGNGTGNEFIVYNDGAASQRLRVSDAGYLAVGVATGFAYGTDGNRALVEIRGTTNSLLGLSIAGSPKGYLLTDGSAVSLNTSSSGGSLPIVFGTGDVERLRITSAGVIQDGAGNELGYRNIKPNTNSWVRGQCNVITAGATVSGSNAGDTFSVFNNSASSVTLTQGAGVTLRQGGTTNTGNRTLLPYGFATIWYLDGSTAVINGNIV